MITFLLYCDMQTMKCTVSDIDKELGTFVNSFVRVNDSLCFFKYPKRFDGYFVPPSEWILEEHLDKFMDENSIVYIEEVGDRNYCNLPDDVISYVFEH